ncbi:MAG: AMP-binding protein [Alphaproteobacteria bacterium]|nr:AMP-binding protein [Alphaproteobacteria bacterium]
MRAHELPAAVADPLIPVCERAPGEVLFRRKDGVVTVGAFLADAVRVAACLPDREHAANLCQDRYWFTVAFVALLIRGQTSLLTSDRSTEHLSVLARDYRGLYGITDTPAATAGPLRLVAIGPGPGPREVDVPAVPAMRLAAIVFTSGSTGGPMPHRKLWGALAARSRDAARRFGMRRRTPVSVVGTVPAQHMYGFETTVLLPLHAAASSWCGPGFFPHDVAAALAAVPEPRLLVTTPLQIRALLGASVRLPPLARVISATAPLLPELAARAEASWGAEVYEIFGATEVGSIASRRTVAGDLWTAYPRIRLHASRSRAGEEELLVTGPFAEPCALSDVVERADARHFRLLGRRTDVVKLGGRRTSLAGLNRILTSIEGVEDGLFIAPDDLDARPTARLLAFVVAPGLSAEAVMAALRERVDPLFLPRRIVHVDRLPRNETGKLPDRALAGLKARADET